MALTVSDESSFRIAELEALLEEAERENEELRERVEMVERIEEFLEEIESFAFLYQVKLGAKSILADIQKAKEERK